MTTGWVEDIDQALRKEQMERLWQKHGGQILVGLLVFILCVAGYQAYRTYVEDQNRAATDALLSALETKDPAALKALPEVHRALAALLGVPDLKETAEKKAALKAVADDRALPRDLRDLAMIMNLRLSPPQNETEAKDQAATLRNIVDDPRAAFSMMARLDLSTVQAHALSDPQAARATLAPLLKPGQDDLPPALLKQAQALDHVYAEGEKK